MGGLPALFYATFRGLKKSYPKMAAMYCSKGKCKVKQLPCSFDERSVYFEHSASFPCLSAC